MVLGNFSKSQVLFVHPGLAMGAEAAVLAIVIRVEADEGRGGVTTLPRHEQYKLMYIVYGRGGCF